MLVDHQCLVFSWSATSEIRSRPPAVRVPESSSERSAHAAPHLVEHGSPGACLCLFTYVVVSFRRSFPSLLHAGRILLDHWWLVLVSKCVHVCRHVSNRGARRCGSSSQPSSTVSDESGPHVVWVSQRRGGDRRSKCGPWVWIVRKTGKETGRKTAHPCRIVDGRRCEGTRVRPIQHQTRDAKIRKFEMQTEGPDGQDVTRTQSNITAE